MVNQLLTELDGELFQIVAWKALACAIFNIGLLLARGGWRAQCSNLRANAKPLLVLGVINTLVTSGFTLALALTVAARALLLTSLSPLWTALIGWLVLKDRLPRRTIAAVGFALRAAGSSVLSGDCAFCGLAVGVGRRWVYQY